MGGVANRGVFLAVIGCLALFGATTLVQAEDRDRSNETVLVCVKTNGGPLRVPGSGGCNASEESQTWVVGGDISAVRAGEGLIGGSSEGEAALGIDPSMFTEIKGGFKNSGAIDDSNTDIATRKLGAGDYAIFAKFTLANTSDGVQALVECSLQAGFDKDHSSVSLEPRLKSGGGPCPNEVCDSRTVITLALVHTFEEPGQAVVSCHELGVFTNHTVYSDLKIVAIRGVGLENVQLD